MPRTLIACLACCAGVLALDARPARALDAVTADYCEDAPAARPVAEVRATLLQTGGQRELRLALAARGARVVPVPGLHGVHGANLRTARELHRLLDEGTLAVVVRDGTGADTGTGRLVEVERASLPARALLPGDLDLDARTPAAWPVRVSLATDALPTGDATVDLVADGVPRLRVTIRDATIVEIASLGGSLPVQR